MDIGSASWVNLALQIPLALVIVFLVIRFLAFVKELVKEFLDYLKEQRQLDRQQMSESINRLSDNIHEKSMDELKEIAALTRQVDSVVDKVMIVERMTAGAKKSS